MSAGNALSVSAGALEALKPRIPYNKEVSELGLNPLAWKTLVDVVHPAATDPAMVLAAFAYCKERGLDPMKRVVHIVPRWDAKTGRMKDTIMAAVNELRMTAHRTGQFAGMDEVVFGQPETKVFKDKLRQGDKWVEEAVEVSFPSWARVTVYRLVGGARCSFPGPRIAWLSIYQRKGRSTIPNDRWATAPYEQLEKCAEAAALRRAFPEEAPPFPTPEESDYRGETLELEADHDPETGEIKALAKPAEAVPDKPSRKPRSDIGKSRKPPQEAAPEPAAAPSPEDLADDVDFEEVGEPLKVGGSPPNGETSADPFVGVSTAEPELDEIEIYDSIGDVAATFRESDLDGMVNAISKLIDLANSLEILKSVAVNNGPGAVDLLKRVSQPRYLELQKHYKARNDVLNRAGK